MLQRADAAFALFQFVLWCDLGVKTGTGQGHGLRQGHGQRKATRHGQGQGQSRGNREVWLGRKINEQIRKAKIPKIVKNLIVSGSPGPGTRPERCGRKFGAS